MLSISQRAKIMPSSPIRKLVPYAEEAKKKEEEERARAEAKAKAEESDELDDWEAQADAIDNVKESWDQQKVSDVSGG